MKEIFVSREIQDIQKLLEEYEELKTRFVAQDTFFPSTAFGYFTYVTTKGACVSLCTYSGLVRSTTGELDQADILAAQRLLSIKRQLQSYKRQYSEA